MIPKYQAIIVLPTLAKEDQQRISDTLSAVNTVLPKLLEDATKLATVVTPAPASLKLLRTDIQLAIDFGFNFTSKNAESLTGTGDWFYTGFGALTPAFLDSIAMDVTAVAGEVKDANAASIINDMKQLAQQLGQLRHQGELVMQRVKRSTYEERSIRDTAFAGRILDVIFRELNIYAVSPLAMFDVARLGPRIGDAGGIRAGLGPGVRFSLANWNLNVGYAWTLNRRPGESPHALTVSLSVSDLFR